MNPHAALVFLRRCGRVIGRFGRDGSPVYTELQSLRRTVKLPFAGMSVRRPRWRSWPGPGSPEALHWMLRAAESGVIECQIGAGDLLSANGQKQAAAVWYDRASSKSPRAAFLLGQMYESGDGVTYDARHAALLYMRAATAGLPEAQTRLANLYMIGEGVPLSYSQARRWYLRAARQGYGEAFLDLAGLFFHGLGVPRDIRRARGWAVGAKSRSARDADAFLAVIDSRQ